MLERRRQARRGVRQGGIHRMQSTSKILIYYLLVHDARRPNEFQHKRADPVSQRIPSLKITPQI